MEDGLIEFYAWIKALHILSVIAWMAGMLYLPRLYVYHCDAAPDGEASEMLKSFYEVNRIVKTRVIGHNFKYKMKHPDYKKALLELTKQLIKSFKSN